MRYELRRNLAVIDPLISSEPGLRAHLLRVAALATRVAERQGWSKESLAQIETAAMLHHHPVELLESHALAEALKVAANSSTLLPAGVLRPIRIYRALEAPDDSAASRIAALIESANLVDEHFENLPYEERSTENAVQELLASGILDRQFVRGFREFRTFSRENLTALVERLPIFPAAAVRALSMAKNPDVGMRDIERVVSTDPVLAGEIVQVANSGLFGRSAAVSSLTAALARLGTITAARLIAAAALRPLVASAGLQQLWMHSLETAETAVLVAVETTGVDISEAYLAGLLHDIGRLVFATSSVAAEIQEWLEAGFPITYAEVLTAGIDHGELGGEILTHWNFAESIITAVRNHHRPELTGSRLAALLHMAENFDESLPSCARDHLASKRLESAAGRSSGPRALRAG